MNPEDIKIGERVSLSGYIANKTDKHFYITIHTGFNEYTKIKVEIPSLELYEIMPKNGIKNTESAPKYDPYRKFRKGDIVRLKEVNGRKLWVDVPHLDTCIKKGATFTVKQDEDSGGYVDIVPNEFTENTYTACALCVELVTPVEELEPYYVEDGGNTWVVRKPGKCGILTQAWFAKNTHPHAKEAAEAERDRLNAEHRKGMEQ